MQFSTFLKVALLMVVSSARAEGYSTSCTDISYNAGWLIGTCPTDDASGEITSSVNLGSQIGNDNAQLTWTVDGEFVQSCSACHLVDSGATLNCSCSGSYTSRESATTLNLEQHIANYDGHLLSNLTSAITTIPANSTYAVPYDFTVELQISGISSCASGGTISWNAPKNCSYINLGAPSHWSSAQSLANQGWEVVGYGNEQCTGDALVKFTPGAVNTCVDFTTDVYAFSVTPLWNAN